MESRRLFAFCAVNDSQQSEDWRQALYEQRAAGLMLYGRALGLSHGEAEDVLHDTFVALIKSQRQPEEPAGYCIRAFRNRALNYRRSMWRRLTRELESKRWFEPNPEASDKETQAMICLAKLPTEQREVIVLKVWNELTFDAIGRLLDISPNTAAGRYRYGIDKLRVCLKGVNNEERRTESQHARKTVAILDTPESFA
jgi:RNA polymerase sigma-70 factor (ECF subfamily)